MRTWRRALFAEVIALAGVSRAGALEIRSDVRVDLMGLLQQLSGDDPVERSDYLDGVLKRFAPFRSHAAVRRLRRMSRKGFRGNVPGNYAVYLSTPPALREAFPVPEFFSDKAGGRAQLDSFLAELNAFVRDAGFLEWHASQNEETSRLETALRETFAGIDLEGPLVRYLGLRSWDRWVVVPSAFFLDGARSAWVLEEKPGLPDIYVVVGPEWDRGRPSFSPAARAAHGIWAEPIYSTLYMMVEFCRPGIRPVKNLCETAWRFSDLEDCLEKRWVDAIRLRLHEQAFRGVRPPGPSRSKLDGAVYSAMAGFEGRRDECPDMIACSGELLAPLQSDGLPVQCRIIDESRFQEELYARRLGWYLEMRLARSPDPALLGVRARLREARGPAAKK